MSLRPGPNQPRDSFRLTWMNVLVTNSILSLEKEPRFINLVDVVDIGQLPHLLTDHSQVSPFVSGENWVYHRLIRRYGSSKVDNKN